MNEVEALYVLYEKLSRSLIDDGLIHKVCILCFRMMFVTFLPDLLPFDLTLCDSLVYSAIKLT